MDENLIDSGFDLETVDEPIVEPQYETKDPKVTRKSKKSRKKVPARHLNLGAPPNKWRVTVKIQKSASRNFNEPGQEWTLKKYEGFAERDIGRVLAECFVNDGHQRSTKNLHDDVRKFLIDCCAEALSGGTVSKTSRIYFDGRHSKSRVVIFSA